MTGKIDWSPLEDALRKVGDGGGCIRFWWRDDDAIAATQELDRLIRVANDFGAPLLLAVIPKFVEDSLADCLETEAGVCVGVHGYAHVNHAPTGEKKQELGDHRPLTEVLGELEAGRTRLCQRFGESFVDVLVPPWNRVSRNVQAALVNVGFSGLSCYGSEKKYSGLPGLAVANTHIDPVDWHGSRSLSDPERLIESIAKLVAITPNGSEGIPLGLLTHHLVHDEALWNFVMGFCETLAESPNAAWCDPAKLFARQ